MSPADIIRSQGDAARVSLSPSAGKRRGYLIGEKLLNFLAVAEIDRWPPYRPEAVVIGR